MKNTKGITLVALVITIIILLILAGISIQAITQTGLLKNAQIAKQLTQTAQNTENNTLESYENKIDNILTNSREITDEKNAQELNSLNLEEKVIGKFIDNKPLYQKTIIKDYTTGENQKIEHNISDVEIIYIDVSNTFMKTKSSGYFQPFISTGMSGGTFVSGYTTIIQSVNSQYVIIRGGPNNSSGTAYITLRYTKTTD